MDAAKYEKEFNVALGEIIAKAWSDPAFKTRFETSPGEVLKEAGISVPPGVAIKVVEDTPRVKHLIVPIQPGLLSESDLDSVAGGGASCYCVSACCEG